MPTVETTGWSRQESRSVRPFRFAAEYLRDVGLRLYAEDEFSQEESIQTDKLDLERLAVSIKVPLVPLNLEEMVGISPLALRLVITFEDRTFKNSLVALDVGLEQIGKGNRIFEFDDSAHQISWTGDSRISVAIVLADAIPEKLKTARRIGSWVARKTFAIGTRRDTSSFSISAVEPDYFVQRNLPASTTYLVEINDSDLNQGCENLPELIKVSVTKDVHSVLVKGEDSPLGRALVRAIYVDVLTTVLATGYSHLGKSAVASDSIIDVVTARLSKSTGIGAETIRSLASQTAGSQLRAIVQADIDLSRALISAVQRRQ